MHRGYIKLHRKIKDHWLYEEKRKFSKFEAWIDILMRANHKDTKIVLGNELIEVKRGQLITSEKKLMETWGWGKSKTRDFLKLLENDGMIIKKSDHKKTIITVCNYNAYHDYENENRPQSDHEKRELENSRYIENEKIRPLTDHDKVSYDNDYSESSRKIRPLTDYEQTMNRLSSDTEKNDKNVKNDKEDIVEIVNYLNDVADKNFRHSTKKTQTLIKARLREGFTVDDFKKVIDTKTKEWKNDKKMNQYLRPETLFGTKFESYLNQNTVETKNNVIDWDDL